MFKKLKDKLKGDEKSPDGTDQHNLQSNNPYYQHPPEPHHATVPTEKYQAPAGPLPNQAPSSSASKPEYSAPPGRPPNHNASPSYTAPPGPPPNHQASGYVPPPGPPPSYPQQPPPSWDPPPYHDWTVIPDTALLPPPPSMGYDSSPTANASAEEGDRGLAWTRAHALWPPQHLAASTHAAVQNAQLALLKPPCMTGELIPQPHAGHWRCRTHAHCRDASILTNLPLYSAVCDSPLATQRPKTIYFELKVLGVGRGGNSSSLAEADAGIAVGFVAPPYPTFRLPGWERASLAVHGDDGRKYVNDAWGGIDFTTAFKPGDTVGVGVTFSVPREPPAYGAAQQGRMLDIDVFFTRNGVREGGWDGNEELDVRCEGGNVGLRGECDLFAAIGVFGGVDFDVFFHPSQWLYRP